MTAFPLWTPGDCPDRQTYADGVTLDCDLTVEEHADRDTGPGHYSDEHGTSWGDGSPGVWRVDVANHKPCPARVSVWNVLTKTWDDRHDPSCSREDCHEGTRHSPWCGCVPTADMLDAGSVLTGPDGCEHVIVTLVHGGGWHTAPLRPNALTWWDVEPSALSPDGGWWVVRAVLKPQETT